MSGKGRNRRNWTGSLTIVMVVAVAAAVIGCMVDIDTDKTDRLYLKNSAGPVLFDHKKHSQSDDSCIKCHHDVSDEVEASSCRECHPGIEQSETFTVGCIECHDNSYSPEILDHYEYLEIDEHSCLGCHTPRSVSEAYHTNCSRCHLETSPKRFTTANGELLCGACHLR